MILDDSAHANLLRRVRALLLGVLLFGSLGLLAELVLLEHWEEQVQQAPLVLLGAIVVATVVIWIRPADLLVRLFRVLMVASVMAGAAGTVLHFRSNAIFEREIDPTLSGPALVESALFGATPSLAPGALIQLGLLGLVAVYRHPGLKKTPEAS